MALKPWLALLVLAFAAMVVAEASTVHDVVGLGGSVEESIGDDGEMLMESESSRRTLAEARYISYNALKANRVPCGRRGRSYYNCQQRQRANPYNRGCSVITHCYRWTD